jgi:hypothetical protein
MPPISNVKTLDLEGAPLNVGSEISGAVDTSILDASGASESLATPNVGGSGSEIVPDPTGVPVSNAGLPPVDLPQTPRFIDGVVKVAGSLGSEYVIAVKNLLNTVAENAPLDTYAVDPQQGL